MPNYTPATAIDITRSPYTILQDVSAAPVGSGYNPPCAPGQYYAVWWKYTAQAGDAAVAVLAVKASADAYEPVLSVWTGTLPTLTIYTGTDDGTAFNWCLDQDGNYWAQISVTPGTTYYFQVSSDNATVPGVNLSFQFRRAPHLAIPAGSLLVLSDDPSWPAVALAPTTGALERVLTLPASECAAILADGTLLIAAEQGGAIGGACHRIGSYKLYGPALNLIATLTNVIATQAAISPVSSDRANTFYCARVKEEFPGVTAASLITIDRAGVVGGTSWTLPANSALMSALAIALDGSVAYYTRETGSTGDGVHRYDLVGAAAMSDLVAGTAGADYGRDLLMLSNSELLAVFRPDRSGANTTWVVKRYHSTTGAVLATYSFGLSGGSPPRIAHALDDPLSFWVMTFPAGRTSRFQRIRISDGVVLTTFDVTQRSPALYTPDPNIDFGPAQSCPLLVLAAAVTTTGTIVVQKVTNPASDPQTFQFQASGGLFPPSFTLQDGDSQSFTVPSGNGYGLFEVTPGVNWAVAYVVSNGSPIDDLVVAAGETVTVTVTNIRIGLTGGGGGSAGTAVTPSVDCWVPAQPSVECSGL